MKSISTQIFRFVSLATFAAFVATGCFKPTVIELKQSQTRPSPLPMASGQPNAAPSNQPQPVAARASSLSVSSSVASSTAGSSFSITVSALDSSSNKVSGYSGTVQFSSDDSQASLPASYTFTSADQGAHTFSVTLKTSGSRSVKATDSNSSSISGSKGITVNPASASKLIFNSGLSASSSNLSAVAGSNLDEQPKITVQDAYGNVVSSTNSVSLAAHSSSDCSGSAVASVLFSGTSSVSAVSTVSGVASFSNVNLTKAQTFYLKAATGSLSICSRGISVSPTTATAASFSQQPSASATVAVAFAQQPKVSVSDEFGNLVSSVHNIQLSAASDASCQIAASGVLSGNTASTSNGISSFSGVAFDTASTIHLKALVAVGTSSITACSSAVVVQAAPSPDPQPVPEPQPVLGSAILSWNANTETDLAGYKVHYGPTLGGPYTNSKDIGLTSNSSAPTFTVDGLTAGSYFFVVSAYDSSGNESGFSNEVSKAIGQ